MRASVLHLLRCIVVPLYGCPSLRTCRLLVVPSAWYSVTNPGRGRQAVKAAADVRDALLRAAARANLPVRWLPERLAEQNFNLEEPPTRASPWVAVLLSHLQVCGRPALLCMSDMPCSTHVFLMEASPWVAVRLFHMQGCL